MHEDEERPVAAALAIGAARKTDFEFAEGKLSHPTSVA